MPLFTPLRGPQVVRTFPFGFGTDDLASGVELYVPMIGDVLYAADLVVTAPWNGTTPKADLYIGEDALLASVVNLEDTALTHGVAEFAEATGDVPALFVTDTPLSVVVSQDGTPTVPATVLADGAPSFPVTVSATHDKFVFTPGGGGGSPMTFTIASGSYTTLAELVAAMAAALDGATAFSSLVTPSVDSTKILLTMVGSNGLADNGNTITEGASDDVAALLGFTGNPDTFASGAGGSTGATEGAGVLYLITATPA